MIREQPIEITRGTSEPMELEVTDRNGTPRSLASGEKILFGIKKEPAKETDCIFVKELAATDEAGVFTLNLYPEDTINLAPGVYWYDINLESGGDFIPVIRLSRFTILPNVTKRGDSA